MKLDPSGTTTGLAPVPSPTPAKRAAAAIHNAILAMEEPRTEIVEAYRLAPPGSILEHELGETLTHIRKALARARKARDEIRDFTQAELPLDA